MDDYDRVELARWAFYNIGASMTGPHHAEPRGPVQWLEPTAPDPGPDPSPEAMRLFDPAPAPMPGQLDLGT